LSALGLELLRGRMALLIMCPSAIAWECRMNSAEPTRRQRPCWLAVSARTDQIWREEGGPRVVRRSFGVFIVIEDNIVRRSLRELVQSDDDLQVVGQANGANQALAQIQLCDPDVALVDDGLPDGNGFDLCRDLRSWSHTLQCIVFASYDFPDLMFTAIRAGASGCIIRNAKGVEMVTAIKSVAAGEFLYDTGVATAWLADRVRADFLAAVSVLTEQEGELLRLLAEGHSDSQIGTRMRLDEKAFRACIWGLIPKAQNTAR
jgi:two-component system, NarL family, response regulator DevR